MSRIHLGFPPLVRYMIGLKHSRHFLIQFSHPITEPTVSRSSRQLHVFDLNFDWSIGLSVSHVIGQGDNFGLVLKTALKKH